MLTQLICYEVVELLNRKKRSQATPEDVETVIPRAFETAYQYFDEFWTNLTGKEQQALITLAKDNTSQQVPENDTLHRLIRRGVIIQDDSKYTVRVPLICRWIVDNCNSVTKPKLHNKDK
ncbi:MAG: hypothetical protein GY795_17590 [Desulfobacterales bacterium]|nr:hypothetical protein [Desulfobacterales bacterium]